MNEHWRFRLGDLLAGAAIGATVAVVQYLVATQGLGLAASMMLGMVAGMLAQMLVSVVLGAFLGSMEVMLPGMFVGMLGMILPMLGLRTLELEVLAGCVLGLLVFTAFAVWDARLRGRVQGQSGMLSSRQRASSGWWNSPQLYDAIEVAGSQRRAQCQKELFHNMEGKVLFVAAGTGLNFENFPPGRDIVAIDISPRMLEAARPRALRYEGALSLCEADAQELAFPDESFDTVATGSTLCSVPDPVRGLRELYRVLKPGGKLLLFEHVRSRNPFAGAMLDLMNAILHYLGPSMNRDTEANVRNAGFVIDRVVCAYLDVFLTMEAHKPFQAEVRNWRAA